MINSARLDQNLSLQANQISAQKMINRNLIPNINIQDKNINKPNPYVIIETRESGDNNLWG